VSDNHYSRNNPFGEVDVAQPDDKPSPIPSSLDSPALRVTENLMDHQMNDGPSLLLSF
ncbi:hypothetical protein HAX54_023000, partial [Datura stramonium]|nr:hypothetical protein [Datura stramonium]